MFGLVPSFFKAVPDSSLDLEWQLFKRVQLEEGLIPQKYKRGPEAKKGCLIWIKGFLEMLWNGWLQLILVDNRSGSSCR